MTCRQPIRDPSVPVVFFPGHTGHTPIIPSYLGPLGLASEDDELPMNLPTQDVIDARTDWTNSNFIRMETLPEHALHFFTRWTEEDILSPTRFPDSLATVCRHWRTVLESVSAFWTRLVIFVDANHRTPLSDIRRRLTLSGDHLLEIIICRHPASLHPTEDRFEQSNCGKLVRVLWPYLERWRTFRMDVWYRRSLAQWHDAFEVSTSNLLDLRFTSVLRDFEIDQTLLLAAQTTWLDVLDIDARLFQLTYAVPPVMLPTVLTRLTLRGAIENTGLTVLSLVKILCCMLHVTFLYLVDVDFAHMPYDYDWHPEEPEGLGEECTPTTIILEGLPSHALEDLFGLTIENLTLRRCEPTRNVGWFEATNLTIEQIDRDLSFRHLVREGSAAALTLRSSPELTGRALDGLSDVNTEWDVLGSLKIQDCH